MFVHFYLPCKDNIQKKLHHSLRHKIGEWRESGTVNRVVLTYHFNDPPHPDYLQLCLDIPAVKETIEPEVEISQETKKQIPSSLMEHIEKLCQECQIKLSIRNYVIEIQHAKKRSEEKGQPYYGGAPVEEIIRFASTGTRIAIEILDLMEKDGRFWTKDVGLADYVYSRFVDEFGTRYSWISDLLHFVCNPLALHGELEQHFVSLLGNQAFELLLERNLGVSSSHMVLAQIRASLHLSQSNAPSD